MPINIANKYVNVAKFQIAVFGIVYCYWYSLWPTVITVTISLS